MDEGASSRTRNWVVEQGTSTEFSISWWVETEVASALSKKVREGQIEVADRDRGMKAFKALILASAETMPVVHEHFRTAERLCLHETAGLRASDALHLAIAAESDSVLCTLDKRMAQAGMELGVATELV